MCSTPRRNPDEKVRILTHYSDLILSYDDAITAANIVYNEKVTTLYFATAKAPTSSKRSLISAPVWVLQLAGAPRRYRKASAAAVPTASTACSMLMMNCAKLAS